LPPNSRAEFLDIAVRVVDKYYGMGADLYRRDPEDWPFMKMGLGPGEYYVRVQVRAIGIDLVEQWLLLTTNPFQASKCDPPAWKAELDARGSQ
jgi:hypothetical protein